MQTIDVAGARISRNMYRAIAAVDRKSRRPAGPRANGALQALDIEPIGRRVIGSFSLK